MASKKSCFIIMPISTPESLIATYGGDQDHFEHVLEALFVPAIKAAGLEPIRPISKGSGLIHGDIIRSIETAEIVLCDMSALNANVFFELGIRTATNKVVALVKDTVTEVPFDLKVTNHHTYKINYWEMEQERDELKTHLKHCLKSIDDGNALWKHFSVSAKAISLEAGSDVESQLALLNRQIGDMRDALLNIGKSETSKFFGGLVGHKMKLSVEDAKSARITAEIYTLANTLGIQVGGVGQTSDEVHVTAVAGSDSTSIAVFRVEVEKIARGYGKSCRLTWLKEVNE